VDSGGQWDHAPIYEKLCNHHGTVADSSVKYVPQMASMAFRFYQIRFRSRLRPEPRWGGTYDAPQESLVGWEGDTYSVHSAFVKSYPAYGDTPPHSIDAFGVEVRSLHHLETDTGGGPINPIFGSAPN